ncbi:hypothetical protein J2Z17_003369 [Rhizobium halophytocola]|uniref:Uncharacterized protein n=1 Tax=Rhizobium halophytocola TaxID=735519 RepID=A0ABS4E1V5_9HYPH|nr:hypothetical protein [Rhizobium halophytocola]
MVVTDDPGGAARQYDIGMTGITINDGRNRAPAGCGREA